MGLTIYEPAPMPKDEPLRERAVEASGALNVRNDPVLQRIVEDAKRAFGAKMAAISIVHLDWQYLIAASGLPSGAYSRRTSFCGHAIVSREPVFCVLDAEKDPSFAGNPAVAEDHLLRFYAGAPLLNGEELPLGALCVFDPRPRDEMPAALVKTLRDLAGRVIARLEELQRVPPRTPGRLAAQ